MHLQHPFYDERDVPVMLGDHVTAEDGTGAVHTAPGHGQEDFAVGQKYGLLEQYSAAQINPVDGRGVYLPSTPPRTASSWPACTSGRPTSRSSTCCAPAARCSPCSKLTHSYPHCWRHKTPVAFRATPQWFIVDGPGAACAATRWRAIGQVGWVPGVGRGAHRRHDRGPPGLVHLAPAHLGRADRAVRTIARPASRIRARRR